jgi:predicted AlkP superfamily pyrophosphatase or phosphodiesterase
MIIVLSFLLVGCKQKKPKEIYYELTLPNEITSNQIDNTKVKANELVVLTVNIPDGKEITSLKINGEEQISLLDNNKIAFEMTSDTVVYLGLKDIEVIIPPDVYYVLTLPEGVTSNQKDNGEIKEDTEVLLTLNHPIEDVVSFKVNGIEKKDELSSNNTYAFIMTEDVTVTIILSVYYSLTLPDGVISDQENNNKIKENTTVTLTINTPIEDIASFKVNDIEKKDELINNTYTFVITEDVVVSVILNVYYNLTLPEGVNSNQEDNTKIKENTTVTLTINAPIEDIASFKVNDIEKKDELINNMYTFVITEDVVVSVILNVYYNLTLPEGVNSNQEDNTKIKENTTVTLSITAPIEDIASFKVNDIEKKDELINNMYTFVITEDIVVNVTLNVYYTLTLPEGVCSDQENNDKIKKNTEVLLTFHEPVEELSSFKINNFEKIDELTNDTYSFVIIEDTIVTIEKKVPEEDYYAVYINIDGFPKHIYDEALSKGVVPNLSYYGSKGMFFTNLQTIFPSITNAVQAAIISGAHSNETTNVIAYFDKTENKVISQERTNLAPTFYQVAASNGISIASVRHYPAYPDPLSTTNLNLLYINVPEGETADGELRFSQAIKALKGEEFVSGNLTLRLEKIPRLFTVYVDDLDAIGHNGISYGNTPALSLEGRRNNVINALAKLDAKIGELVEVYKEAGIYDKTVFAITTDHGMSPYGSYSPIKDKYGDSKLPALKAKIESINPLYKFESLAPGESPNPGTTVVAIGDNLQKGLTFIGGIKPSIQELIEIQTILQSEPYIYKVYNRNELILQQIWRGAGFDLVVVPSERYHFSSETKYYHASHDTYLPTSKHIFGIIFGGPVKQKVVNEEALNISFGKVIAETLKIDLGPTANAPTIDFWKEE